MPWVYKVPQTLIGVKDFSSSPLSIRKGAMSPTQAFARPTPLTDAEKSTFGIDFPGKVYLKRDSDDRVDFDGDIVMQKGHDLAEFRRNPLLNWLHCRDQRDDAILPIGQTLAIKKEIDRGPGLLDQTLSAFAFAQGSDQTELSKQIEAMWEAGIIKCSSIGFTVQEVEWGFKYEIDGEKKVGNALFLASTRKEDSLVNNPANGGAGRLDLKSFGAYRESLEQGIETTQDKTHRQELEAMYKLCRKDRSHFDMSTKTAAPAASQGEAPSTLITEIQALRDQIKTLGDQIALSNFDKAAPASKEQKAKAEDTDQGEIVSLDDPNLVFEL